MALALCLVILDVFVEVARKLYPKRSAVLIAGVQGVQDRNNERKTHRMLSRIAELTELNELREIQTFLE
jgi:hypothetical protein